MENVIAQWRRADVVYMNGSKSEWLVRWVLLGSLGLATLFTGGVAQAEVNPASELKLRSEVRVAENFGAGVVNADPVVQLAQNRFPREEPMTAEEIRALRYSRPSTQESYLLLMIKNAETNEVATIVVPNSYWILRSNVFDYSGADHSDYVKFMVENDQKPFVLAPEIYEKFSESFAVEPLTEEQENLTVAEFVQRYLEPIRGSRMLTARPSKLDINYDKLAQMVLSKGGVYQTSCLDGHPMIILPSR